MRLVTAPIAVISVNDSSGPSAMCRLTVLQQPPQVMPTTL